MFLDDKTAKFTAITDSFRLIRLLFIDPEKAHFQIKTLATQPDKTQRGYWTPISYI